MKEALNKTIVTGGKKFTLTKKASFSKINCINAIQLQSNQFDSNQNPNRDFYGI